MVKQCFAPRLVSSTGGNTTVCKGEVSAGRETVSPGARGTNGGRDRSQETEQDKVLCPLPTEGLTVLV